MVKDYSFEPERSTRIIDYYFKCWVVRQKSKMKSTASNIVFNQTLFDNLE
jgi:hypothetical protein